MIISMPLWLHHFQKPLSWFDSYAYFLCIHFLKWFFFQLNCAERMPWQTVLKNACLWIYSLNGRRRRGGGGEKMSRRNFLFASQCVCNDYKQLAYIYIYVNVYLYIYMYMDICTCFCIYVLPKYQVIVGKANNSFRIYRKSLWRLISSKQFSLFVIRVNLLLLSFRKGRSFDN